jgi:murein DD-endopeptidase MepM/ murein hydrolase activator NlpD
VGKAHTHLGVDFATPVGTPVKAPENAVVSAAGSDGGHAGTYVILNANGVVHKFYHLSRTNVKPVQAVKQGDVVAFTGNTGYSTGPHLHWEKHVAGRPVNPVA